MNLSFKVPHRIRRVHTQPIVRRRKADAEPQPAKPATLDKEDALLEPETNGRHENTSELDKEEIERLIAERAAEAAERLAEEKIGSLVELVEKLERDIEAWKQQMVRQYEEAALKLAVAIAEKVVRQTIAQVPEVVERTVRDALSLVDKAVQVQIRCNPEDLQYMRGTGRLQETTSSGGTVEWREDPEIERGGCIVSTERGLIDATIASQLREIGRQILGTPTE